MKRETLRWLKKNAKRTTPLVLQNAQDHLAEVDAELTRLRRKVEDLRSTCRLASDELDDVNGYLPASLMSGGHVYEALKKGGGK